MSVQIERHHFTVSEYYRMGEAGIFTDDDRVELIDGEVLTMSPIGSRHAACVDRINAQLSTSIGKAAIVRVQNPIRLDDFSEPQPDIALLRPRADFYAEHHPTPTDVLLVVEVADTSVAFEREVKSAVYARAGIAEMWLINLPEGVIEIYAEPAGNSYRDVRRAGRGETFASSSLKRTFNVDDILV